MAMWGMRYLAAVVSLALAAVVSPQADAMSFNFQLTTYFQVNGKSFVSEGGIQVGPLGHAIFCTKNAMDCGAPPQTSENFINSEQVGLLQKINETINSHMKPRNDMPNVGFGDIWTVGGSFGDCEDFALTKMSELLSRGIPASAMRIAVVRTQRGEPHALLIARTLKGDVVLDNLSRKIVGWDKTDYQWLMIQSNQNLRQWRKVNTVNSSTAADIS